MADLLDQPLRELIDDLDRLEALVCLVRALRAFGSVDTPPVGKGGEFETAARDLRDSIRGLNADLPVLSGTLVLYLAGRFEHFVRASFQGICDGMAAKCQTFQQLPERMRDNLRLLTAEVSLSPAKYGFDPVQARGFLVTFADKVRASDGVGSINSACLAITQNNMAPGVLSDLYKRIGIGGLWADLSKQASLKTYFEVDKDAYAEREAKAQLEELMSTRNQIAHPSGSPSFPDPDKVSQYIGFVRVLAQNLTAVSKVHLVAFKVTASGEEGGP